MNLLNDHNYKKIYPKKYKFNFIEGGKDDKTEVSTGKTEITVTEGIILATHNARIRCFLTKIMFNLMQQYLKDANVKEVRFKNCCILKLAFKNNSDTFDISMLYEGEVDYPKKGAYFVKSVNEKENRYKGIVFKTQTIQMKEVGIQQKDKNYNIYIIRHGEAEHNIKNINVKTDTLLTEAGMKQAERSARTLKNELKLNNEYIKYIFCSNLKRTKQTLVPFIFSQNPETGSYEQNPLIIAKNVVVLPCSHELKFVESGKCDGEQKGIVAPENKMDCNRKDRNKLWCDKIQVSNGVSISIDWDMYDTFYKQNNHCRTTNLIQQIFMYLQRKVNIKYENVVMKDIVKEENMRKKA
jgi:broad specificity phosphatase PhoE